jgi:hypothetical protein
LPAANLRLDLRLRQISGIDVVRAYVAALGGSIDVVARLGDRSWKVA